MNYTSGVWSLIPTLGMWYLAGQARLPAAARALLETSGALFGLYVVLVFALLLAGRVMRRGAPAGGSWAGTAGTSWRDAPSTTAAARAPHDTAEGRWDRHEAVPQAPGADLVDTGHRDSVARKPRHARGAA